MLIDGGFPLVTYFYVCMCCFMHVPDYSLTKCVSAPLFLSDCISVTCGIELNADLRLKKITSKSRFSYLAILQTLFKMNKLVPGPHPTVNPCCLGDIGAYSAILAANTLPKTRTDISPIEIGLHAESDKGSPFLGIRIVLLPCTRSGSVLQASHMLNNCG